MTDEEKVQTDNQLQAEPNPDTVDVERLFKALQVVNENVRQLSETVNQHSQVISQMAEIIEHGNTQQQYEQRQPEQNNGNGNGVIGDVQLSDIVGLARNWQQRNQPNPMADLFNRFVNNVIDGQMTMMQSNANLNNALAQQITNAYTNNIVKKTARDLDKLMMSE